MTDAAAPPITPIDIQKRIDEMEDPHRVNRLVDLLAKIHGYSDTQLGHLTAMSRPTIHNIRRSGRSLRSRDVLVFAAALGVEPIDLLGQPSEVLARFITEHRIGDEQVATDTLLSLSGAARARRCTIHLARAS